MSAIYLIQDETGPVLIGIVNQRGLKRRVETLQEGNPNQLTVRRVIEGDNQLERELHVRFKEHRIRGDWYQPAILDGLPADLRSLDALVPNADMHDAAAKLKELDSLVSQ